MNKEDMKTKVIEEAMTHDEIVEECYEEFEKRNCGSCRVMNCTILNALADTGKFRLVNFGCNLWKEK